MKVIKNINNNVSLCLDSNNNEVVAFGKGIGFTKPPYEIDLSRVERTYWNIDETYIKMINDIDEDILEISSEIIDYARTILDKSISSNIVFTLADHIQFAIKRTKENMNISLPILYDIQYLYEKEIMVGKKALKLISHRLKINLPEKEAGYIALHIINCEKIEKVKKNISLDEEIIDEIIALIEKSFSIDINKESFNYSRFVSHMHYLLKRGKNNQLIQSANEQLYELLINKYPKTSQCADCVSKYLNKTLNYKISHEEKIYLILHINRLCSREDCYQ